jgi:hypothetical protein
MTTANPSQDLSESSSLFSLTAQEQGIVVFHFRPSMPYGKRVSVSFALIVAGLVIQALTGIFWAGAPVLLAGSLLLCVRGYHNRVESGSFNPDAAWENVDIQRLRDLQEIDKKMLRWNRSFMDVTNSWGIITLILVVGPAVFSVVHHLEFGHGVFAPGAEMLLFNALILLTPHWVTGTRRILRLPKLMVKVEALQALLGNAESMVGADQVTVMMLLKGKTKIPEDVKLQIQIPDASKEFLGMYVQVVTNDVKGTSYPYVYVVLVAKRGYGLEQATIGIAPPKGMIKEYKEQDDVEIVVVRQHTTKTSGYHTKSSKASEIFTNGLNMAKLATSGKE